jgi:MoxR-like ATPase
VTLAALVPTVASLRQRLDEVDYLADDGMATALFCAVRLPQPLLLEGEAGVGKTEAAKALAALLDTSLIRLQCYEGIDAAEALYEWNYPRQLLAIRVAEASGAPLGAADLFGEEFLTDRPLLEAIRHPGPRPAVLLIDEIDRADDEFEAFLFELLAESAVTIPELGTVVAAVPPVVVLTSNRTRDLHDALKRRCLYHWIDHPTFEREVAIVRRRFPEVSAQLAEQVTTAVQRLRAGDLVKPPGVAETLDWTDALVALGAQRLDADLATRTLGAVLKYREDQQRITQNVGGLPAMLAEAAGG